MTLFITSPLDTPKFTEKTLKSILKTFSAAKFKKQKFTVKQNLTN